MKKKKILPGNDTILILIGGFYNGRTKSNRIFYRINQWWDEEENNNDTMTGIQRIDTLQWQLSDIRLPMALAACECVLTYENTIAPKIHVFGGVDASNTTTDIHLQFDVNGLLGDDMIFTIYLVFYLYFHIYPMFFFLNFFLNFFNFSFFFFACVFF